MRNRMKSKWLQKPLLLLLCLVFVLNGLPAMVFAEEAAPEEAAVEEAAAPEAPAAEAPAPSDDGDDPILTNRLPNWPQAAPKQSDYVCLLDATTDTVLMNKGMDVQTPPASLTKIMTTLVALENGKLDDYVTMTETGVEYAVSGSSNLYTVVGESFTLRDMLYGVMLASANDMATQVAEYIGGSVENFVDMMNERAKELGCKGTHFVNACGMPADGHVSTAYDMALIAREAMKNETFREITGTTNYTIAASQIYAAREITNHHPSLSSPETYGIRGVIGGKTGYTDLAQNCLVTFCERNGRLLICVTMHAAGIEKSMEDTVEMLQYGYGKWKVAEVETKKGETLKSGGQVVIPKKAKLTDCETKEKVRDLGDGTERVRTTYYWDGVKVGSAVLVRTIAEPESTAQPAASAAAAFPPSASGAAAALSAASAAEGAGSAASDAAGSVSSEAAEGAKSGAAEAVTTDSAGAKSAMTEQKVVLPFGTTMNKTSFISIAVLALLILLGIILILITIALRG